MRERFAPRQRVQVDGIDQRSINIEDCGAWHETSNKKTLLQGRKRASIVRATVRAEQRAGRRKLVQTTLATWC
ncbi:hypothetical protein [Caballeronia sp. S22]|uniref:hypothetical protein n=1 Tax=Caballeronia sp. S22 TaxID=3137182 RepID=UPI0035313901